MNDFLKQYSSMQSDLFPMVEEELGELTARMKEFYDFSEDELTETHQNGSEV